MVLNKKKKKNENKNRANQEPKKQKDDTKSLERENMKRRDERKNRVKTIIKMVKHLKRVKAGPITPLPPWKVIEERQFVLHNHAHDSNKKLLVKPSFANNYNQLTPFSSSSSSSSVSAGKLAATLWEFQHYLLPLSAAKMHRHDANGGSNRLRHHVHSYLPDPCSSSPDQRPASASSLRRHVAASLMQHHRTMERSNHALQSMSPASYGSSMEMTPYHQAVTPSSSIDFIGRNGESSFNLKTSTELLKVLNRIWSLEEQHASDVTFIKALKTELDHTRSKVKELVRERKSNRQETDDLMKKVTEDKLVRKKREQDQINAAVKSMKEEVEDERRLKKRSESLHRKLAKELTEAKSSLYSAIKEMEKERKTREVLEDLCDEFAKGIKEYEQEVHGLRQKCDKNWANRADFDGLILHTSESWLDERMQMKLRESQFGFTEQNSVVDKLSSEIETLFKAKQVTTSKIGENLLKSNAMKENLIRRHSMESVPLQEALSAPQDDVDDEEAAAGSNTNCLELNKSNNVAGLKSLGDEDSACATNKPASREKVKARHPSLQVMFEEQVETADTQKSEIVDKPFQEGNNTHGSTSNYMIDRLIMSQYMSSGSRNMHHPELDLEEGSYVNSIWRSRAHASPVQQWKSKLISTDLNIPAMESCTKLHKVPKENNSLKAKLLAARSKGHARHHSRMKASK